MFGLFAYTPARLGHKWTFINNSSMQKTKYYSLLRSLHETPAKLREVPSSPPALSEPSSINMEHNYNARMSQQFRSSQQQQQQRTKKKEDDSDLFMRLVSLFCSLRLPQHIRCVIADAIPSPTKKLQDVSAT